MIDLCKIYCILCLELILNIFRKANQEEKKAQDNFIKAKAFAEAIE